jgi:hypothetical protein
VRVPWRNDADGGHLAATLTRLRRRKTNCCLVLTPLVFSVVLGGAGAWRMQAHARVR